MFIKCKVLNHIILAKEKHGRENTISSLFSVAKATLHSQMSVRLSVRKQNPSTAWNHHLSSFILQHSSFFIPPSFISRLLSFSACFQSRKRLYNHQCLFVRPFVCLSSKPLNSLKSSSFIIHLSSFIILHSSFIHPSFILHHSSFILPSFRDF